MIKYTGPINPTYFATPTISNIIKVVSRIEFLLALYQKKKEFLLANQDRVLKIVWVYYLNHLFSIFFISPPASFFLYGSISFLITISLITKK
jgi:hypothetical protein